MKRRLFWGIIVFGALFLPWREAALRSALDETGRLRQVPVPPAAGRGAERRVQAWLSRDPTSFAAWMAAGRGYLARKEFEQAIWAFRKAVEMQPLSSEARFLLGVAFERRGREGLPGDLTAWDRLAETEYRTAAGLDDHLPSRFNLGLLCERQGRYDEARREFEHILTIAPQSVLGRRAKTALERTVAADLLPRLLSQRLPLGRTAEVEEEGRE